MTDARFPERWLNDRRIMRLPDDLFRLFVVSLAWSVANRTDGYLYDDDLAAIPGATRQRALALQDSGLWRYVFDGFAATPEGAHGWLIDEFEETQTTKADLTALDQARKKARDKKRGQRANAAKRDVPGDVPRDSTRTGQARTGSTKTEGQVLKPEPAASASPTPGDADASMNGASQAQHIRREVQPVSKVTTVTRASGADERARRQRIEKFLSDHPEVPRAAP